MARTRGRCWAHVITTGVAVCIIALGAGSCKTTKPKNLRTKDPAPKTDTTGTPKKTLGDTSSNLVIDALTITLLKVGGNTVVQGEVSTAQTFDYVEYTLGTKTAESSTSVFTISDAPVGENTLKTRLCLRAGPSCGEYASQSFTQPKNADPELQKQMVAAETANQDILQQNKDLNTIATDYANSHPDEKSDIKTTMDNIAAAGPDMTNTIVTAGGLDVIDTATSGTPGATTGGATNGTTTEGSTGSESPTATGNTDAGSSGSVAGAPAGGSVQNSTHTNVLLYLGVPVLVLGASAIVGAGANYKRETQKLDVLQKQLEEMDKLTSVSMSEKSSSIESLKKEIKQTEQALIDIKRTFQVIDTFETNEKTYLGEKEKLEAVKNDLSSQLSIQQQEENKITERKNLLNEVIGAEFAKIDEKIALKKALNERKVALDKEIELSKKTSAEILAELNSKYKEDKKKFDDMKMVEKGIVEGSFNETEGLNKASVEKSLKEMESSLKVKNTLLIKTRFIRGAELGKIEESRNEINKKLETVSSDLKKYAIINDKMKTITDKSSNQNIKNKPEELFKQALDAFKQEIEKIELVLNAEQKILEKTKDSLKTSEAELAEKSKVIDNFKAGNAKYDELKAEIDVKKQQIESTRAEMIKQRLTNDKNKQEFTTKVDADLKTLNSRTTKAVGGGVGAMMAGIVLTAASQTVMGLTGNAAMSDQAFSLWLLDGIEVKMRRAIADREMARYKILTILNK